MRVQETYIRWTYQTDPNERLETICTVHSELGILIGEGVALKHPNDSDVKEKGRKIALSKALQDMN